MRKLTVILVCPFLLSGSVHGGPPVETPESTVKVHDPPIITPPPAHSTTRADDPPASVLGSAHTAFASDPEHAARSANIRLAAGTLNGKEIGPGEVLSFNATVGPRTEPRGFRNAPSIFMQEMTETIGGGTCQVSSTLYEAALRSGLQILERRPHSRPPSYTEPGMDAMVNFPPECESHDVPGCSDLKIRNPYGSPVRVSTSVTDGQVKSVLSVEILGGGVPPKVGLKWTTTGTPAFERRNRTVSWWKDGRERLKSPGRPGLQGFLTVRVDGNITAKVRSDYKPVPEVWEVGSAWENAQSGQ